MKIYEISMVLLLLVSSVTLYNLSYAKPISQIRFDVDRHNRKYISETINIFLLNAIVMVPVFVLSLLFLMEKRRIRASVAIMVSSLVSQCISGLLVEILKVIFGEWRPDYYSRYKFVQKHRKNRDLILLNAAKSFPSGHTANAFCALVFTASFLYWTAYSRADKLWKKILHATSFAFLFFTALAIGVERVINNKHFLHDVFVGALIGALCGAVFYYTAKKSLEIQSQNT